MRPIAALAALALLAPGCAIYFPDGDDDDDCEWGGGDQPPPDGDGEGAPEAPTGLRNPSTGQCEYYGGGGGGGGCNDPCGCDDTPDEGEPAPLPSWGYCDGYCTGLDEQTCLATAGCRGGYIETCPTAGPCDLATQRSFYECWQVDQTGPIQGSCENLDAWSCSVHDDCVAVHHDTCNSFAADAAGAEPLVVPCLGEFLSCQPEVAETGCYGDDDCAAEEHCNAADVCLPPPGCEMGDPDSNGLIDCPAVCYGWCVPDEQPVTCEQVTDEMGCLAREDCSAIYQGINCTMCDADGCVCEDYVFAYCQSDPTTDPPPMQ
jgi:hypothetical protein